MGIGYIILIAFGTWAALKFYKQQKTIEKDLSNMGQLKPGVSVYQPMVVTQRPAQAQAYQPTNTCQTTPSGYAPAFGPNENQPGSCEWIS